MIVCVDNGITFRDANDLGRLHIQSSLEPDQLDNALKSSGLGRVEPDGRCALRIAQLHRDARRDPTLDPDWDQRWASMLTFAQSKGWVSRDGQSVYVHVEAPASPDS